MSPTVYFNGAFIPKDEVRISPDDRGFLFADGVYEVARAYGGRLFELDAHLRRMANGIAALEIAGVEALSLREVFTRLLALNGLEAADATVYAQVTRGAAPRTHWFPTTPVPPTVYAEARPFAPRADAAVGISVITAPDVRWARCDIKTVGLLPNCLANQRARAAGALEAVFVRDGVALEGTSSSFFAVVDGEVRTAPTSNYILPSISRAVVLRLCDKAGLPHRQTPVFVEDLPRASELFMAGTTLEVMPVVQIDGRPVGDGAPGPVATKLQGMFRAAAVGRGSVDTDARAAVPRTQHEGGR
jgi:D-alanine transaminase